MKLAITPEAQRQWMMQWRQGATALEEFRQFELQALTDDQAWQQIEAVLSLAGHYPGTRMLLVWWNSRLGFAAFICMNELFTAAMELQLFCDQRQWRFCFIGGVAVQIS